MLGASGFLGKNLCRRLHLQGYDVIAYGKTSAHVKEVMDIVPGVQSVTGDFVQDGVRDSLLDEVGTVFHLVSTTKPANKDVLKDQK